MQKQIEMVFAASLIFIISLFGAGVVYIFHLNHVILKISPILFFAIGTTSAVYHIKCQSVVPWTFTVIAMAEISISIAGIHCADQADTLLRSSFIGIRAFAFMAAAWGLGWATIKILEGKHLSSTD